MILVAKATKRLSLSGLIKASGARIFGLFAMTAMLLTGCGFGPEIIKISGTKMGTNYSVTVVADQPAPDNLEELIEAELNRVDQSMSTYKSDSEISQFNALAVNKELGVSTDFYKVLKVAEVVWAASGGAFEPTVAPLVDLWGFGPTRRKDELPDPDVIADHLLGLGLDAIKLRREGDRQFVSKTRPVQLDLSAVAKGYAVDLVADLLEMNALPDYLVEVGGEMRVSGSNPDGQPWRLAIETPTLVSQVQEVLALSGGAVATSGDYRNYFEYEGARYSHTLDPRSGYPISHGLASVTVLSDTCAEADAWATALMVMGTHEGMELANKLGLSVYMISRVKSGFETSISETFDGIEKLSLEDGKSTAYPLATADRSSWTGRVLLTN